MGARGTKRKRKDGSVANGRSQQRGVSPLPFPPLQIMETEADPIAPEFLEKLLTIRNRHGVFGPAVPAEMTDEDSDEAEKAADLEVREMLGGDAAETSLFIRGLKLEDFLGRPENRHLYSVAEGGAVTIEDGLLRHAAEAPMTDHPDDPLQWPLAQ